MAEMTNIELKDFTPVTGVNDNDSIVLVLGSGIGGRMGVALFKSAVTASVKPSIEGGHWWVGNVNTGVEAAGKTPEFRKGALGIEWKYTVEPESGWRLLVGMADICIRFEELTDEQRNSLKLTFADLTEEEIAELQKPAADMVAELKKTNEGVASAERDRVDVERLRVAAETNRGTAETGRASAETTRVSNESLRVNHESTRVSNEESRVTEFSSLKKASEVATADAVKQAAYAKSVGDAVKNGHITITEAEYNALVASGTVNPETFYYIIEAE